MAKIKAPLFSLDASGTLDKTITYRNKPQNNTASKYAKPGDKNPFESSPRQKDQRSIIGLITACWQCKTSLDQLAWNNAAKDARFKGTGYHYFLHMAQSDLTTYLGLVGFWSMNYNIGDKIPDLSGNGNHGTLMPIYPCDCPQPVDSFNKKHGKALKFNGTTNYITSSDNTFSGTGPFTIELYFNMTSFPPSYVILAAKRTPHEAVYAYIFYIAPNYYCRLWITGLTPSTMISSLPLTTGFYHCCYIYDGSNMRIYINGVEDANSPVPVTGTRDDFSTDFLIGVGRFILNHFPGIIDDIRIYNRALSPEEIQRHYNLLI